MIKHSNKKKVENWINERALKGYKFTYASGTRFGYEALVKVICEDTHESLEYEYKDTGVKNRFPMELVDCVRKDWFTEKNWMGTKTKKKDLHCCNCKKEYKVIFNLATTKEEAMIGLMQVQGKGNQHLCHHCCQIYIDLGARDIKKEIDMRDNKKETLIKDIRELGNYNEKGYYAKKLDDLKVEELEKLYEKYKVLKEETDRIDAIVIPEEDRGVEEYLKNDYGVKEDWKYLKCVEQIESYFKEDSYHLFECGQGYAQEEAEVICKIGKKFYQVTIKAEIGSAKQDRGDRLYWVEDIEKVTYEEIPKPVPKERTIVEYRLHDLSEEQISSVENFFNEQEITYGKGE